MHRQNNSIGGLAQQTQMKNPVQAQTQVPTPPPMSPKAAEKERARVTVLLEINAMLLNEVISLQAQGKSGTPSAAQQSPIHGPEATSPTSATDPNNPLNNSPTDPSKPAKAPSPEYVECMRRLQANLSYLATVADAKKKAAGNAPAVPQIMVAPPHLDSMKPAYEKLATLFSMTPQHSVNRSVSSTPNQPQS